MHRGEWILWVIKHEKFKQSLIYGLLGVNHVAMGAMATGSNLSNLHFFYEVLCVGRVCRWSCHRGTGRELTIARAAMGRGEAGRTV